MILQKEFLRELKFNLSYSPHTVSAYQRDLSCYENFCKTGRPLQEFYHFLTKKNLSPRSQARIVSAVRTYLKFLQKRGQPIPDIKHLSFPQQKNKLPKLIQLREFKILWNVGGQAPAPQALRNRLVLAFLYGLGCRVTELVALNLRDFNETEGWISVLGKGDKQRLLPLQPYLYKILSAYLNRSRPILKGKREARLSFSTIEGGGPPGWIYGDGLKPGP